MKEFGRVLSEGYHIQCAGAKSGNRSVVGLIALEVENVDFSSAEGRSGIRIVPEIAADVLRNPRRFMA